ncbi:MAG: hypothetical protein H6706_20805 [Myxococcales bacterium]|nr:hypothetical protein [Myxococcales bacterium]
MTEARDEAAFAARLEQLRRSVDLRLDREGRWFHEGEPFEHARLIALFDRGIDAHPETGEPIVHIGDRWCYFQAEDTPFLVRRLEVADDGFFAHLNNGERLAVPATGFEAHGDHVYVDLAPDRHRRARLDRATQSRLWADLDADGACIVNAAGRWPVRS